MDREIPVVNRIVEKKQVQKRNDRMVDKIMTMKYANFSFVLGTHRQNDRSHKKKLIKLSPILSTNKKMRSLFQSQKNIKEENERLYHRLVKQKSLISNKNFIQDRHKNVEYLKRIGRYPYQRLKTDHIQRQNQLNTHSKSVHPLFLSNISNNSNERQVSSITFSLHRQESQDKRLQSIKKMIIEQDNKQHSILLYQKKDRLNKKWYTIKFYRLKYTYEIQLTTYPIIKTEYILKLDQRIATQLLSQNDYDYNYIVKNCIKSMKRDICFGFQVRKYQNKRFFFKFMRKDRNQEIVIKKDLQDSRDERSGEKNRDEDVRINLMRRTIFAIENEAKQIQLSKKNRRFVTEADQNNSSNKNKYNLEYKNNLSSNHLKQHEIRLSGIT